MKQITTLLLLCLFSSVTYADNKTTEQKVEFKEMAAENKKDTYSKENLNNDMAVAFGEKSTERQASEIEFAKWSLKLNEFLLTSDSDFAQAMTLAKMISGIESAEMMAKMHDKQDQADALNDLSYQPIADAVNQLIAKPELSSATFDILTSICFKPVLIDHCHANVLLQKRMIQDTKNLQAYLRPFDLAVKTNTNKTVNNLIQIMAASEFSQSQQGLNNPGLNTLIDDFIANNPIPQSATDNLITDYRKISGLSPTKKAQLEELMPNYMPVYIKFSYLYLNDVPPYKTVLNYCQTNIAAVPYCRKIAQIMIQQSNSMIDKGVGHSLLIATFELERDQAGIKAAQQLNDDFRQSYECIGELTSEKYFIDNYFDPEYQKINFNSSDEFETSIQLAELRYRNLKAAGDKNAVNPDSCFNELESATD